MTIGWLYTLPDCSACEKAEQSAMDKGYDVRKILADDPLSKLGLQMIFNGKIVVPVLITEDESVYVFNEEAQMLKVSFRQDRPGQTQLRNEHAS